MGLDFVELVMELEQEFDLRIPEADAERLRTVEDVAGYISTRMSPATDGACLTSRTFYALRRRITWLTGAPRSSVRPSSPLEAVLKDRPGLALAWRVLRREFPSLPDLVPPRRAQGLYERIVWAGAALGGVSGVLMASSRGPAMVVGLALGAAVGGMVAHAFTSPWLVSRPQVLPPGCVLVRDAVMLAHIPNAHEPMTRDVVEFRVRRLVAEVFGASLEDVRAETRLVEDLGAD